jgi:hypothetical protein
LFILALAKTVTPGGRPRREPGRPAPPLKLFHFDQKIFAVQKPIAYTDLLGVGIMLFFNLGDINMPYEEKEYENIRQSFN